MFFSGLHEADYLDRYGRVLYFIVFKGYAFIFASGVSKEPLILSSSDYFFFSRYSI